MVINTALIALTPISRLDIDLFGFFMCSYYLVYQKGEYCLAKVKRKQIETWHLEPDQVDETFTFGGKVFKKEGLLR